MSNQSNNNSSIVYLKADYAFTDDQGWHSLKIKIDEESKKISYERKDTIELSFDEAEFDFTDTSAKYYLDNKGNFYLTESGVNHLNENCDMESWEMCECFFPFLKAPENKVFIFGETEKKLNTKIYNGLKWDYSPHFTAKSAAWIIAYQDPKWFGYVLRSISLSQINDIVAELNLLFEGGFKLNSRIAKKVAFFINSFRNKISPELIEETAALLSKNGYKRLNPDYNLTPSDIDAAYKLYIKYCKDVPFLAWTLGPIDELPSNLKSKAVENYLNVIEHDVVDMSKWEDSYLEHIKRNAKTYIKKAAQNEFLFRILLEKNLLSDKWATELMKSMQDQNKIEEVAQLLDYINKLSVPSADKDPFSDSDREMKRIASMQARREQIKEHKGISGLVFVASGELENFGFYDEYTGAHDLKDLQDFIEERNGIFRSSVSGKTDYLICNDITQQTTKIKKAQELGVAVISEQHFLKMAEDNQK